MQEVLQSPKRGGADTSDIRRSVTELQEAVISEVHEPPEHKILQVTPLTPVALCAGI